jgi:formamidopyrimidine-DNA glycosylase
MTGFLRYFKGEEEAPPHTRVLFVFEKHRRLAFDDQRKFGEVGLIEDVDDFLKKRSLGPDALVVDLAKFRKLLGKRRGAVKAILLNQKLLAGIGNLYADEILFRARIHPATQITKMRDKTLKKLFRAMRYILRKAIEAKADVDLMPKSWLLLRRGKGGKCPRFCAHCQKRSAAGRT